MILLFRHACLNNNNFLRPILGMDAQTGNKGLIALGQRLRELRKAKGWSMQHLANVAEIELSQVARIETAKINPKMSTVFTLIRALDLSVQDFFNFEG
jgi:DNA-binding XRE family transcriptional regulator